MIVARDLIRASQPENDAPIVAVFRQLAAAEARIAARDTSRHENAVPFGPP